MSIIYSVIARINQSDITNLCSYDLAHGNYPSICQQILKNAKINESKIFNYNNQYNFHILKDGIYLYVCMAASSFKNKAAFAFLNQLSRKFKEKYSQQERAAAKDYDMSAGFSENYKNLIVPNSAIYSQNFYNNSQQQDSKDNLMKQLNTLLPVMSQNIQKVLQNEQKVSLIVKKTQKVHSIADQIRKNASAMKKDAFCKKYMWWIIGLLIIIIAAVVVYFVVQKSETKD